MPCQNFYDSRFFCKLAKESVEKISVDSFDGQKSLKYCFIKWDKCTCIILKTFPHCGWSYSLYVQLEWIPFLSFHTSVTSLHCGRADTFLDFHLEWISSHKFHICGTSPHCGWVDASLDLMLEWIRFHKFHICPHCQTTNNISKTYFQHKQRTRTQTNWSFYNNNWKKWKRMKQCTENKGKNST